MIRLFLLNAYKRIFIYSIRVRYLRYGYVEFADTNAAQKAMELHGTEIGGRAVRLDFSEGKRDNGSSKKGFLFFHALYNYY